MKVGGKIWGENLRDYRVKRGLTLAELSKKTGFSKGWHSHIETGYRNPSNFALKRLCKALGQEILKLSTSHSQSALNTEILEYTSLHHQKKISVQTLIKKIIEIEWLRASL